MRAMTDGYANPHSLLDMLPGIYASDELACRLVRAFDDTLAPVLLSLDNLADYLDPALAPEDFLAWLGGWVAAVDHPDVPVERRRLLVRHAVELHAVRGTAAGLARLLELCVGPGITVEDPGATVHSATSGTSAAGTPGGTVVVRVPEATDRRLVDLLVSLNRPAHIGYRIETGSAA